MQKKPVVKKTPTAPKHLRPATRKWWSAVAGGWALEDHHLRLLTLAGESWDRTQQAREAIDTNGLTYNDRFGAPRTRPEVAVERDSRLAFARLLRELNLDDTAGDPSRPPRVGGAQW
ncbi:MAG: hypothetical protein LLG00_04995 [Planctomycetaceae bacterium]|nr:hypothetical protein [Planctomycetaceae bacterium]